MKNLYYLLSICFALTAHSIWSQPLVKFGEVSIAELSKNVYEIDSSADAVVLYDKGVSRFVGNNNGWFDIVFEKHTRIKILKSSAFELATHEIPIYDGGAETEILVDLDAVTYNIENAQIVKSNMENSSVFKVNNFKILLQLKRGYIR
jgi:hypothetical protein